MSYGILYFKLYTFSSHYWRKSQEFDTICCLLFTVHENCIIYSFVRYFKVPMGMVKKIRCYNFISILSYKNTCVGSLLTYIVLCKGQSCIKICLKRFQMYIFSSFFKCCFGQCIWGPFCYSVSVLQVLLQNIRHN